MFENYVKSRNSKVVNEIAAHAPQGTAHNATLDQANVKRVSELLDMLKTDANLATKFALRPEEFADVIEWAKNKIGGSSSAPATSALDSLKGESVVKEKKEKDEDNIEIVARPKAEETEEEYLARRDAAIKASISAKEESEEQAAIASHYNTNHEALDLVDHLLTHPKKYSKSDVIKIITLASDKLQNKA